ncbi:DUF1659 domain-containing protein [Bacillus andreraoultii]|uniref:DUF1659 domain-containing protein n=1 Tax=Bacillus andreraoultii TaxID=1499685 RepID=UPI0005A8F360|nr:DUF1659 domain-containing protein [Bacillus andreraoultii]
MKFTKIVKTNFNLVYQSGLNQDGKPTYKRKNYNNVKSTSSDETIYQVAQALASLCVYSLETIERDDKKEIYG